MGTTGPANRRRYPRYTAFAPLRIDTDTRANRLAVTRNVSRGGVLFHSLSSFERGEQLTLTLPAPDAAADRRRVRARVVWSGTAARPGDSVFRHLTAVEFDVPLADLPVPAESGPLA